MALDNGAITVHSAIETMLSSGQKNRMEGVANLKIVFEHNSKSSNLEGLKDGAYHSIFEALFKVAHAEKQAYLVAKTVTMKTKAERSLEACSDVLRIAIRAGADKLKKRTVKAVIEHVIQLLPVANGEYCAGLSQFYLKVLGTLLEHDAHVEQLEDEDWIDTVDFCLQGINNYKSTGLEDLIPPRLSASLAFPASTSERTPTVKLPIQTTSSGSSVRSITRRNSEELLECLHYLMSASNAPILERAGEILQGIINFLRSHGFLVSPVHQTAFSALNLALYAMNTDRAFLVQSMAPEIIPLIGQLWSSKSLSKDEMLNSVRDEMLVSILLLQLHMERIINDQLVVDFQDKIEELSTIFWNDYSRRTDRDQLQLEDLDLGTLSEDFVDIRSVIQVGNIRLRSHAVRAERKWANLYSFGMLDGLLHIQPNTIGQQNGYDEEDDSRHPRKRRRVIHQVNELAARVIAQDLGERLIALQILLFVLPNHRLSKVALVDLISQILTFVGDKQEGIASWSMLVIALCSQQDEARSCSLDWASLWRTIARLVTTTATCRSACFLLHSILANNLILYKDIAEDVDSMVTATEINAPILLCDTSVLLMIHLLHNRNMEAPVKSFEASHQVLRWLLARWNPEEMTFVARCGIDIHPIDISNLLRTCLGLPAVHLSKGGDTTLGTIGQAWIRQSTGAETLRYLLLLKPSPRNQSKCSVCTWSEGLHGVGRVSDNSTQGLTTKRLILELFLPKFESLLSGWEIHSKDEMTNVSTDTLRCCASSTILGYLLLPLAINKKLRSLYDQFEAVLHKLSTLIIEQLGTGEDVQALSESLLQATEPYLPASTPSELNHLYLNNAPLMSLFSSIASCLAANHISPKDMLSLGAEDPMDLDDIFDTQHSRKRREGTMSTLFRRNPTLQLSPAAFYSVTLARLALVASKAQKPEATDDLPSTFVDYVLTLPTRETLLCSQMLRSVLRSDFSVNSSDASRLVEHTGDILSSAAYDCCEVALTLCMDTLTGTVSAWASFGSIGDLPESARQLYEWFIKVMLPKRRPSFNSQIGLVDMLFEIMRIEPTYGEEFDDPPPSARSSIFNILLKSSIAVKFHISRRLPDMFGLFLLKDHSEILSDVIEALPSDPDWTEGIAFRLHVLSSLASKWPSLIRQCIYYIIEVPGNLPKSVNHARRCVANVSESLGLQSAKALFHLFASQLLYTWLVTEPIDKFPFQIFGYESLQDLAHDSREEITGLLIMRNQDEEVNELADVLGTTVETLLQHCFTKIMAYSIPHDISIPRAEGGKKYVTGEARIRKRLGKELFFDLVNKHFADIIALFFSLIDQEEQVEKSFEKDPKLVYAADIMTEIKSIGSSGVVLPPNQQPAFKAKYLTSEIEHLCGRTEYEVGTLYSSAMMVFIARSLLNTIHPALGSLHACAALRKLRMLIALSGTAALDGYQLEMLLHSLIPFMTDAECADDVIGIAQYLLHRGSAYLANEPSFVTGIALSITASLRGFLNSHPSSTTQQSQYRRTLSKAQTFHDWLGLYLMKYDSVALAGPSKTAFRSLASSAHAFHSVGNADKGTPESSLLRDLLDDEISGRRLLNKSSRNLAVSQLYNCFAQPSSFRSDMLGDDSDAVAFAPTLWNLCRDADLHGLFLIWSGKVLGRAFAATGHIHQQLKQDPGLCHFLETVPRTRCGEVSKSSLLRLLQTLTLEGDRQTAGLAEAALRVMISMPSSESATFEESLAASLYQASVWSPYQVPVSDLMILHSKSQFDPYGLDAIIDCSWPKQLVVSLVQSMPPENVLYVLQGPLNNAKGFAEEAFPFIIHLVLAKQLDGPQVVKRQLSSALRSWLSNVEDSSRTHLKLLINTLLYLRTQQLPREKSSADRLTWLDVNYMEAAVAASRCGMHKTALLFVEISVSENTRTARRSSANKSSKAAESNDFQLSLFRNIDDPDVFYGLQQIPNLDTVLARLEHERDGLKSMAFRGAKYDSNLRQKHNSSITDSQALVNALGVLSLDGVSHSLLRSNTAISLDPDAVNSMFQTARKLEQWDLPVPAIYDNEAITIYKTFQAIVASTDRESVTSAIDGGLKTTMARLVLENTVANTIHNSLQSLAVLSEADEVFSASSSEEFEEIIGRFQNRKTWMKTGKFDDVHHILSCRETVLSSLSQHSHLRDIVGVNASDARLVEVQTSLLSSQLNRAHGSLQEGLKSATYLTSLIEPCQAFGMNIEAAAHLETANALWDHGEMTASIGMLQDLEKNPAFSKQTVPIGKPDLLAKIAYQVSVARLEKPDRIIEKYLGPALKELKGKSDGTEAGHVFHEFAVFCDQQLQDADTIEDLNRLRTLKEMKESEVRDLNKMYKGATTQEQKHKYHGHLIKAKQWLQLDTDEFQRLFASNTDLLLRSLENYLLSLTASDEHNNDALRFTALWLEHSEQDSPNESVAKYLSAVPTHKFASLMNQLTSRLLDSSAKFQQLLFELVFNICTDHPYHGMYQIWSGSKTKSNSRDETAVSRQAATSKVGLRLSTGPKSAKVWGAINSISKVYCQFAIERDELRFKAGQKIQLKDSHAGTILSNMLPRYPLPPPTKQVDIAVDLDYSKIPLMVRLESQISIASGVSAPKIITVIANDGAKYRQLVKGGNDDLRQDAIMEQVFSQVSELLAANTSTRQRNLGIRTYKVLPLNSNAGIIEFVPNTIPLHEYLMPAHERYYPKDLKGAQCRKEISDVQTQRLEVRLKKYRTVTEHFHPVMRYFFMENFYDPDEWFAKRLAYTRSTAAISMLGHILGLGDRHGHNILLDERTGEAVHIDLGVAFEMGRVLPVPELVPFRLTRDIIDGMGITKTEGVYRRCCEFTLEALRKEAETIVTILDVLRYDPLYSWSISPVRLAKLQDAQSAAPALNPGGEASRGNGKIREVVNEPSEADRALTVVKKKLSKTLSVTATVNDLINQATDEKNLAVLYSGWAAYA